MNAIAFLTSFESLSKAGTFQIVGWPRYLRLCAPNWKQSPSICETVSLDLWHLHTAVSTTLIFFKYPPSPIFPDLSCTRIVASGLVSPWYSCAPFFCKAISDPKWDLYWRPVACVDQVSFHMRRTVPLTVLLHEERSCFTHLDWGALCPVRPLARHPVACLAMISAFSFPGTPVWASFRPEHSMI
jgi:hypothetical protein